MSSLDARTTSDLQRGECCVLPDAMLMSCFIVSSWSYRSGLHQIHGESPEVHWGGLGKTDGEMATRHEHSEVVINPAGTSFALPHLYSVWCVCFGARRPRLTVNMDFSCLKILGLLDFALAVLKIVRVNGVQYDDADDEMPPLVADEEIPNVRLCRCVRSKLLCSCISIYYLMFSSKLFAHKLCYHY
jgi:hypothetical protein